MGFLPWDILPLVLYGVCIDKISSFKNSWAFDITGLYLGNFSIISSYLNDIESLIEETNAKGTNIYKNSSDGETVFYYISIANQEMNSNGFYHQATKASCISYDFIKKDL